MDEMYQKILVSIGSLAILYVLFAHILPWTLKILGWFVGVLLYVLIIALLIFIILYIIGSIVQYFKNTKSK
jgi:hypothetical protein